MDALKSRMAAIEARHTSKELRKPEAVPGPAAAGGSGRIRRLTPPEEKRDGRESSNITNKQSAGSGKGPGGRGRGRQQAPLKVEAAMSAAASSSSYSGGMDLDEI